MTSTSRQFDGLGRVATAVAAGVVVGLALGRARKAAVQGMEAMAGDWFDVLKAEHRAVEALFEKLEETSEEQKAKRAGLFMKIKYGLSKHAFQEETVIYPALRKADPDGAAKQLNDDHFSIKALLSECEQMDKAAPEFMTRMRELRAIVQSHVHEEENVIFPPFHARLGERDSDALTAMMHKEGMKLA